MILTPAHIAVPAGEEFSASVTVWPAGPRHQVSATVPPGADLRIEVRGHKVTVTGRLAHARDRHTVRITLRDGTETAHDTLTIEATTTRLPTPTPALRDGLPPPQGTSDPRS